MDTVETRTDQFHTRLQQTFTSVWHTLRQPETTAVFIGLIVAVVFIGWLLPQQDSLEMTNSEWTATLPGWLQPWGIPLYWFGLSRVFQTFWFWLPVAFLLLSCMIALADYFHPCQQRASENPSNVEWQHPLTYRVEQSVRLPATPDQLLDELKQKLTTRNFVIDDRSDEDGRLISATSQRLSWWAMMTIYVGLILLCLAFIVSYFTFESEQIVIQPFDTTNSRLFDGTFEWRTPNESESAGSLMFSPGSETTSTLITRQSSWPTLFNRTILIPTASEPLLTVTVTDEAGELRRLFPLRTELPPAAYLNLPLGNPEEPLFFLIPNQDLLFQVLPATVLNDNMVNLQVGIEGEAEPLENQMLPLDEPFEIGDLTVTASLNQQITITAWRDQAVPIYLVSLLMVVGSGTWLYFRPPWHIWLIPEVKGRGGQLYGVVEKFGTSPGQAAQFLEQLLKSEPASPNSAATTPDDTKAAKE